MAQNAKWKQNKKLDSLDNTIIYLVSLGGDTLAYLTSVLGQPKQTLYNRVTRLSDLGILISVENNQKHISRKYEVTELGERLVCSMDIIANIFLLKG